jgi:hypothetical protein
MRLINKGSWLVRKSARGLISVPTPLSRNLALEAGDFKPSIIRLILVRSCSWRLPQGLQAAFAARLKDIALQR